ncbi:MAG: bacillithiol biosynthesis cysteine-adding enzyme BshC [Bacteroidota bacterium]
MSSTRFPATPKSAAYRLPFGDLSFSNLFQDYVAYKEPLASFFAGDFRNPDAFREAAEKALRVPRDRNTLADVLLEQNTRWGLQEATAQNIDKLRDPESVVVITGQQLGLFMSPMYIPYKTLTTLLLAKQMEAALNRPVVPVFWLAGEDHDFEEVAAFKLPGTEKPHTFIYAAPADRRGPVGRIPLSPEISTIIDGIAEALPASPNKAELIAFLRATYKPGRSFRDAFATMISRLFKDTGLVVVSVDDKRLKQLCIPLFQQEVRDYATVTAAMEATSQVLEETYHSQVRINPTNLFYMEDAGRYPIDAMGDSFLLRGHGQTYDEAGLQTLVAAQPEYISPNVVLRPIVQDVLFPTISYVAGPGEIAYYAQYKEAYAWANLPMPLIYPRASITLVEPAVQKAQRHFDLPLPAYKEQAPKIFRKHAQQQLDLDLDKLFSHAEDQIGTALSSMASEVINWEASLQKTAGASGQVIKKELDRFKEQIIKAQKRRMGHAERRIHTIHNHIFPGGSLQERAISPLHFLNQYGLDFFKSLMADVSLDTTAHQVINL